MSQIGRREKTLVLCATQEHAMAVRDLVNQMKTSTDPNYCQWVTANDVRWVSNTCAIFRITRKPFPLS
jgi:type I restriction enzyme, R subunit